VAIQEEGLRAAAPDRCVGPWGVDRQSVLRLDSVEGVVWAVPAGGEGAPVEGWGARQDNRLFLDGLAGVCYCFSELTARPARRFMRAGMALAIHAKRKGGQAIENKQLREMVHFAPPMISRTYDQRRETARFARRKESFRFCRFFRLVEAQDEGSEINGGSGARAADVAPLGDSEMASPAPTAGRENRSGELRMRRFAHNLRRESIFFNFFAHNPLKSPDSDE
jgi:hypothetical protein